MTRIELIYPMLPLRFAGVELYFEDLDRARTFYRDVLGLAISDETAGHYVRFVNGTGFVCLERKGSESYPSKDKAVLFFEVEDVAAAARALGQRVIAQSKAGDPTPWLVVHDPEGHNVLLLQKSPA